MAIQPDTKDWTWVLQRPCGECGLESARIQRDEVSDTIRANAEAWVAVLSRAGVRRRPRPETWSTPGVRVPRP